MATIMLQNIPDEIKEQFKTKTAIEGGMSFVLRKLIEDYLRSKMSPIEQLNSYALTPEIIEKEIARHEKTKRRELREYEQKKRYTNKIRKLEKRIAALTKLNVDCTNDVLELIELKSIIA